MQELAARRRRALPANQLGGMVLPEPSDPRWKLEESTKGKRHLRIAEVVVVVEGRTVLAGDIPIQQARAAEYAEQVVSAYQARKALEAVQSDE
jgi:hypothetical protein